MKYALVERERRFLLAGWPEEPSIRSVSITDHYLTGTRVRLRRATQATNEGQQVVYKLTQKIPRAAGRLGLITTMYLNSEDYEAFVALPAAVLCKTRHSVPSLGVDVFTGGLDGLYLAEVEFSSDAEMAEFSPAPFVIAEVTHDQRFTGGHLGDGQPGGRRRRAGRLRSQPSGMSTNQHERETKLLGFWQLSAGGFACRQAAAADIADLDPPADELLRQQ
jgi:CYTH domain-containing protein